MSIDSGPSAVNAPNKMVRAREPAVSIDVPLRRLELQIDSALQLRPLELRAGEFRTREAGAVEDRAGEIGIRQVGAAEVRIGEANPAHDRAMQLRPRQTRAVEPRLPSAISQADAGARHGSHARLRKIGFLEHRVVEIDAA